MCRPEAQLYASHPVVSVSSPPPYQHLSVLVGSYAVALLGVVVALLHGTAVVDRRCEPQRLEVFGRGLNPAQNTSPVWVGCAHRSLWWRWRWWCDEARWWW